MLEKYRALQRPTSPACSKKIVTHQKVHINISGTDNYKMAAAKTEYSYLDFYVRYI